jgi:pimeloyl-ACP methyl ester carboxylesterase
VRRAARVHRPEVLATRAREVLTCDARQEILQVAVPLLYLHGTEDKLIAKESLEEIKRLHPQTISISFRAPHVLLQSKPRETANAIMEFLEMQCGCQGLGVKSPAGS